MLNLKRLLIVLCTGFLYISGSEMANSEKIVPMGMGVMQMSFAPFSQDEKISKILETIRSLLKYSTNNSKIIINTALIYGFNKGENEKLLTEALLKLTSDEQKKLIVVTWVGLDGIAIESESHEHDLKGVDSMYSKNAYEQFINESYVNLQMEELSKNIEFWVGLHRVNPYDSLSNQIEQLKKISESKNVSKIGLSEVSLKTLKEFQESLKISFLETEMSLSRQFVLHDGILDYCKNNNILLLAYSPLDRGIWTSKVDNIEDWIETGKQHPFLKMLEGWSNQDTIEHNFKEREKVVAIAKKYHLKLNELALLWIMEKGAISIPDSTNPESSASNFKAIEFLGKLKEEDIKILDNIAFQGKRYN